jgi:hypothetical protein
VVEEEEAVEPGSKKRNVCSSCAHAPQPCPCTHAPVRPCRAKYAGLTNKVGWGVRVDG